MNLSARIQIKKTKYSLHDKQISETREKNQIFSKPSQFQMFNQSYKINHLSNKRTDNKNSPFHL
ncbi:PMEI domain-containing protein [Psidium guajava]|nr:PMEI domain-containing protein [Psidium guajava]